MNDAPGWRRFTEWDARPLRNDQFARDDPEAGFATFSSPWDPSPSARLEGGRIVEIDGKPEAEFDILDTFIARHHLDPDVLQEAMAMDPAAVARMLVDINVSRDRLEHLARGMTPAKLVSVVATMSALEITFAYSKMRQRRTPGNQAHVTNAKDDPLQLAADSATAVALGFDEIETTMRVASNAWANALACTVGAAVGRGGVLFQCSIEEAEELRIGLAGLSSYAETVSVYGTEQAFVDGDDTPWSKTFLTAAYASRGIKARCTSGASSELLMGFHQRQSVLYLEARCLCLQRAMGVQGTQNGGIDGAPLTASMAGGLRELMAENLIAVWLGLECASGNDTRISESEIRVGAKITPYLLAGSDLVCSGFGSIRKYDNTFNASLFNGEEIEDYLVLQRDFEADGGLTPVTEEQVAAVRMRALTAIRAVFEELGLAEVSEARLLSVAVASGSRETESFTVGEVTRISYAIRDRGLTAVDVVQALARRGFIHEAENLLLMLRQRVSGDYLQTSAILRNGRVLSALNDPNDYHGPGSGYRMSEARWSEVREIRNIQTRDSVLANECRHDPTAAPWLVPQRIAAKGVDSHEVVIGVSPAFGIQINQTTAGHDLIDVLMALTQGVRDGGGKPRVVRIHHTADTSFLGLTAARLSGSGYGIGIQAKGTAVIHRADRAPHLNIELFSNTPVTSLEHYRAMGRNAALYASGEAPEPIVVPVDGQALGARYHVRVALLYAIETALVDPNAEPIELLLALGQEGRP
ncbi:propanediol/glycerol family dehydratase large subunit [Bradyrhizobium jicamae]|uniref:propanediol/glycerol family dehydratase large subunit n=1 Tax=Bradyrhizobium jicamae TaxID=280332 RepID=UPI001BA9C9CF|nr:propanediol/glycerol family dehydratase large subunit [Bradyrhizobium jicamae]MBR0936054.1 propanediol/glycerol family dehydratase large subunit [Bradyrhizobium jicamae]